MGTLMENGYRELIRRTRSIERQVMKSLYLLQLTEAMQMSSKTVSPSIMSVERRSGLHDTLIFYKMLRWSRFAQKSLLEITLHAINSFYIVLYVLFVTIALIFVNSRPAKITTPPNSTSYSTSHPPRSK